MDKHTYDSASFVFETEAKIRPENFGAILFVPGSPVPIPVNQTGAALVALAQDGPVFLTDALNVLRSKSNGGVFNEEKIFEFFTDAAKRGLISRRQSSPRVPNEERLEELLEIWKSPLVRPVSTPLYMHLYLTKSCNQNCSYCYLPKKEDGRLWTGDRDPIEMKWKIVQRCLDWAMEYNSVAVNLLGGEPMLKWNTVQKILDFCDGKIFIGIASNGTADPWEKPGTYKTLRKYDNVEFRFTLWSHRPHIHNSLCGVDGAFDRLGNTIRNATEAGIKTAINIVVNTENISHVQEIIDHAVWLGASHLEITYTYPRPSLDGQADCSLFPSETYYDLLKELRLKLPLFVGRGLSLSFVDRYGLISSDPPFAGIPGFRRCGGGLHLEISPGGNCYPCQLTIGNNEFKLGNVLSSTLEEIWSHKKLDCFRNHSWRNVSNDHCRRCDKLRNCGGGCILNAWLNTRNFGGGDPLCPRLAKGETQ